MSDQLIFPLAHGSVFVAVYDAVSATNPEDCMGGFLDELNMFYSLDEIEALETHIVRHFEEQAYEEELIFIGGGAIDGPPDQHR